MDTQPVARGGAAGSGVTGSGYLDLYDYRSSVFELYRERNAALLSGRDPETVCRWVRQQRDRLFATHPQSALDAERRSTFAGLRYYPYARDMVAEARIEPIEEGQGLVVETGTGEAMTLVPVAHLRFALRGHDLRLTMYWIDVYGGGLFLPFRDATAPEETYGGGRYLFDTIKGSDFVWAWEAEGYGAGRDAESRIVLDFNYAYNPSCAYDPRWSCPLAPPDNVVPVRIEAGERRYEST